MNSVLCHIRQNISDLQQNLVGGPEALPKSLLTTARSLQEEHVPVSWIHPNCQPCTHSLVSWLLGIYSSLVECPGYTPTVSPAPTPWSRGYSVGVGVLDTPQLSALHPLPGLVATRYI